MRSWLSWVVWTALVVAGLVSSFQIWLRAFDTGNGIPAAAPKSVSPTQHRQVPAIIRRWTTPPAPTTGHVPLKAPPHVTSHRSRPARIAPVTASVLPVVSPTVPEPAPQEVAAHSRPHPEAKPPHSKKEPPPAPPVLAAPVTAPPAGPAIVAPTACPPPPPPGPAEGHGHQ